MQKHTKIGLVLLQTTWEGCGIPAETGEQVQADGQLIAERLGQRFDLRGSWVVGSLETAQKTIGELANTDLDLIVLAFQTWVDEQAVLALVEMPCACPMIVWTVLPWRRRPVSVPFSNLMRSTGAVSAFGALGELRNRDLPFLLTWGAVDDPRLLDDLDAAARAARMRSELRRARFGLLVFDHAYPRPTEVDERRLLAELGPFVEHITPEDFQHAAASLPAEQVDAYLKTLRAAVQIDGVPEAALEKAARHALGLAALAQERRLDLLALEATAPEMQARLGARLGLYPNLTSPADRPSDATLYQPEADLGAATANYVLSRLTGAQAMLLEFWFWDEALNQITGGHAGLQDPALAERGQAWVSRDYFACLDQADLGAQIQLVARSGRVTLFQLRATPSGWQAIAASGVVLETRPVVEGSPHVLLRLDAQIATFLNTLAEAGATQHWVMGYGSVLHELETFCQMEQIPIAILHS